MIQRKAKQELLTLANQFKAVVVIGPRQSGKTTLVKDAFPDKPYVNFENPDVRLFASEDPRGFLANYQDGAIFDEVQRSPDMFSYLQEILDNQKEAGKYILTGSNNFLLQENISQSLAGRVAYLQLLPLSIDEIKDIPQSTNQLMYNGGYPAIYDQLIPATKWYANYIQTYVERDVRQILNIGDLNKFEKLLRLCAGRIGQLLNMSSLAVEVGVDVKTVDSWLSVLEAGFVLFRLQPYYENYNKRIVKMPKLYFYDIGLAWALVGINDPDQIALHPFRGSFFENLVILEVKKQFLNRGETHNLYFWRDSNGNEIDLLIKQSGQIQPVEIKSGQTIIQGYFKGLVFWNKITNTSGGTVIYDGIHRQNRSSGFSVVPLREMRF
ncbi:MAG: ATP-binding protein [Saprospiraceae bacterium]|nr:MAG: ATPase AAA [Candidatus Parvibacillus calidus]MCC7148923.1 ATP-binding protein [Saprospiraceae bacterium]MCO6461142.1 ATP-binding protein [Saprospiraceae bacterium]QLH28424.1 MAG: ATP-binding protein [Candidatus Parvibacillus calidus]WKZ64407.1 MAG: ATP-binding protein [Saprospiraceae bacterium]